MDTESEVETDGDPDGDLGAVPYDTGNYYVDNRLSVPGGGNIPPFLESVSRNGGNIDGIFGLCKWSREMGLKLFGVRPALGTTGHLQISVCMSVLSPNSGDNRHS